MKSGIRILIVGHGFVGKAVEYGFTVPGNEITVLDPLYEWKPDPGRPGVEYVYFMDVLKDRTFDLVFICVPTPMGENKIDSHIFREVMASLTLHVKTTLLVVKSTVTPDIAKEWPAIYNPEFLTERSSKFDFVHPKHNVIGCTNPVEAQDLIDMYEKYSLVDNIREKTHICSVESACMIKYMLNCFGSMKITFFNQLYDVCQENDISFVEVMKGITMSDRVGKEHTKVPGFDGKRGYGGACFPKDIHAITSLYEGFTLLEECIKINNDYRRDYRTSEREKEQNIKFE